MNDTTQSPVQRPASRLTGLMQKMLAPRVVVILTAIDVERRAVCSTFGLGDEHRADKEGQPYWRGTLASSSGGVCQLVVAQSAEMGQTAMTLMTSKALRHWKPHVVLLVGIAATASPERVRLGDVVVGTEIFYYERQKVGPAGNLPEPKLIAADDRLLKQCAAMPAWNGGGPARRPDGLDGAPGVHRGVIASGEKVVADGAARDAIVALNRKVLALEMEGYGFSQAAEDAAPYVRHLCIRGISDDGDARKNDLWHEYAAAAAAGFARHFLLNLGWAGELTWRLRSSHLAKGLAVATGAVVLGALLVGRSARDPAAVYGKFVEALHARDTLAAQRYYQDLPRFSEERRFAGMDLDFMAVKAQLECKKAPDPRSLEAASLVLAIDPGQTNARAALDSCKGKRP